MFPLTTIEAVKKEKVSAEPGIGLGTHGSRLCMLSPTTLLRPVNYKNIHDLI